jgi:tyrosine-specific transport protein
VWSISLLAIITSTIGVGVGLFDSLKEMLPKEKLKKTSLHLAVSFAAIAPAYVAVIFTPNAFITVLGFAGMILAVIAILLPTYLFWKIKHDSLHYSELRVNWMINSAFVVGIVIILCEIYNMF